MATPTQHLVELDDVKGEGDPTWSALLGDVSVVLATYGGDQSVPRTSHQRRPPTPGHVRGLRRERQRGERQRGERQRGERQSSKEDEPRTKPAI